mgnify:CR=1 FL=1
MFKAVHQEMTIHRVAVKPTSTVTLDNGHYLSTYTIEDCIEAFTSNLQRLDQIQIYTSYDTGEEIQ